MARAQPAGGALRHRRGQGDYRLSVHAEPTASTTPWWRRDRRRCTTSTMVLRGLPADRCWRRDAPAFRADEAGGTRSRTGRWPYAVVQLRQDTLAGDHFSLVGRSSKEQARVLQLIGPGQAEFVRFGMVRRTYVNGPTVLAPTAVGAAGPVPRRRSRASGAGRVAWAARLSAARIALGEPPIVAPRTTASPSRTTPARRSGALRSDQHVRDHAGARSPAAPRRTRGAAARARISTPSCASRHREPDGAPRAAHSQPSSWPLPVAPVPAAGPPATRTTRWRRRSRRSSPGSSTSWR